MNKILQSKYSKKIGTVFVILSMVMQLFSPILSLPKVEAQEVSSEIISSNHDSESLRNNGANSVGSVTLVAHAFSLDSETGGATVRKVDGSLSFSYVAGDESSLEIKAKDQLHFSSLNDVTLQRVDPDLGNQTITDAELKWVSTDTVRIDLSGQTSGNYVVTYKLQEKLIQRTAYTPATVSFNNTPLDNPANTTNIAGNNITNPQSHTYKTVTVVDSQGNPLTEPTDDLTVNSYDVTLRYKIEYYFGAEFRDAESYSRAYLYDRIPDYDKLKFIANPVAEIQELDGTPTTDQSLELVRASRDILGVDFLASLYGELVDNNAVQETDPFIMSTHSHL